MNVIQSNIKILASEALIIAFDTVNNKYPQYRIGNIVVKPAANHFIVKLYVLPKLEVELSKQNGYEVRVDRQSGKVIEIKKLTEPSPYLASYVPGNIISGKQAFNAGLKAIKGSENFDKEGMLTVELVGDVYQVTFPLDSDQKLNRGPDYAFQVWINSITAEIVKILVAS
jgi:hypothetical protein